MTVPDRDTRPATSAQQSYIAGLTRRVGQAYATKVLTDKFSLSTTDALSTAQASAFIQVLKTHAESTRSPSAPPQAKSPTAALAPGIYRRDGRIIKVDQAKNGTHLLASELHADTGTWSYLGAAARFVADEHRMTIADAEQLSLGISRCCACGRRLQAKESVTLGIGPICRGKYF